MTNAPDSILAISALWPDEKSAREWLEQTRWPNGPVCAHCQGKRVSRIAANAASKVRPGLYECLECREQFTVTVGTVFEDTHLPLRTWLIAFYRMSTSKTQVSALQLQRELEIGSYRTAWHLCHRIRAAMTKAPGGKMGGTVEVDEAWFTGGTAKNKHARSRPVDSVAVAALVQRDGEVRTEIVANVYKEVMADVIGRNVETTAIVNTDESRVYDSLSATYAAHDTVNHSKKVYSRKDKSGRRASTNAAEGFFGNCKNSIRGTHHAVNPKHIHRYMHELGFKYTWRKVSDGARTVHAVVECEGKRVMLKDLLPMKKRAKKLPVIRID